MKKKKQKTSRMHGVKNKERSVNMPMIVQLTLQMKQFYPHLFQTQKGERKRASRQIKKLQQGIKVQKIRTSLSQNWTVKEDRWERGCANHAIRLRDTTEEH